VRGSVPWRTSVYKSGLGTASTASVVGAQTVLVVLGTFYALRGSTDTPWAASCMHCRSVMLGLALVVMCAVLAACKLPHLANNRLCRTRCCCNSSYVTRPAGHCYGLHHYDKLTQWLSHCFRETRTATPTRHKIHRGHSHIKQPDL
jgi:hypothetical protein